jgi:hypothetical protein
MRGAGGFEIQKNVTPRRDAGTTKSGRSISQTLNENEKWHSSILKRKFFLAL